ncbi:hypothetical protein Tco_1405986 [Tanacetum coccineum]
MFNVINISSLMLTVGHHNGTMVKITPIGSLTLINNVILFDVLVVPKYNDLKQDKLAETNSDSGGLYLFDIDNKFGFKNTKHVSPCDICHIAKQTWEPFPLSDHKSIIVGDLVHCDHWGPYRVVTLLCIQLQMTILSHLRMKLNLWQPKYDKMSPLRKMSKLLLMVKGLIIMGKNLILDLGGLTTQLPYTLINDFVVESKVRYGLERHVIGAVVEYIVGWVVSVDSGRWLQCKLCGGGGCVLVILVIVMGGGGGGWWVVGGGGGGWWEVSSQWNEKLTTTLVEHGFVQSKCDYSLYVKSKKEQFIGLLYFQGIEQNVVLNHKKAESNIFLANITEYQKLAVTSSVSFIAAMRVLRYLNHAPKLEYNFIKEIVLVRVFFQMQIGQNVRLTSLYLGFVFIWVMAWSLGRVRNKQQFPYPEAEAEYRCMTSTTCEIIWISNILKDLRIEGFFPVELYFDNNAAIQIAAKLIFHEKN